VLFELLGELRPDNSQKEYYLTDCLGLAVKKELKVVVHEAADWRDFLGVNDRAQLAAVENLIVQRQIAKLMAAGVTFQHPQTCRVEADCLVGEDSVIGSGVCLEGKTQVGRGCRIGHHVVMDDVTVGDRAVIGAGSVVRNYVVNPGEYIPPMSMIQ
jgi:bifunctional UDP-N-acetylglucosamine pyrophosphorylase/glucosamine-1-phosphate N-acetyltransferase